MADDKVFQPVDMPVMLSAHRDNVLDAEAEIILRREMLGDVDLIGDQHHRLGRAQNLLGQLTIIGGSILGRVLN